MQVVLLKKQEFEFSDDVWIFYISQLVINIRLRIFVKFLLVQWDDFLSGDFDA